MDDDFWSRVRPFTKIPIHGIDFNTFPSLKASAEQQLFGFRVHGILKVSN